MGIVPGDEPLPRSEPIPAEEPIPPGVEDLADDVDAIEQRIRAAGPDEVEEADERADAAPEEGAASAGEDDRAGEEPPG